MKKNTPEDVWRKIKISGEDECWIWTGRRTSPPDNSSGYGYIGIAGSNYVAHRVVYALTYPGEIDFAAPRDKSLKQFVLHKCDNRLCCNPKHLFLGNYRDNNIDASKKGRARGGSGAKGERHHLACMTMDSAREIRKMFINGSSRKWLAEKYYVSRATIENIINNKRYLEEFK